MKTYLIVNCSQNKFEKCTKNKVFSDKRISILLSFFRTILENDYVNMKKD